MGGWCRCRGRCSFRGNGDLVCTSREQCHVGSTVNRRCGTPGPKSNDYQDSPDFLGVAGLPYATYCRDIYWTPIR